MKHLNLSIVQNILFASMIVCTTLSCQKESKELLTGNEETPASSAAKKHPVTRGYADHFTTTSTVTNFVFTNGLNAPPTSADDPGGGDGNVSHIGKAHTNFNSHITFATLARVPVHLNSAFPDLAVRFGLPVSMVNGIVYDDKGNSIWFRSTGGSAAFTGPTTVAFSVQSDIVGGKGKFVEATGQTTSTGEFDLATQTAAFSTEGMIKY